MQQIVTAKAKKSHKKSILKEYYQHKSLFIMLLPVIAFYLIFRYGPMYGIIISFKDYYPVHGILGSEWVGLKHFKEMLGGLYFIPVLRNTIVISFYKLAIGFPAPIILALMLNEVKNLKFKKVVQSISYLPHFISWVVLSGILIEFLSPSRGVINIVLQNFGFKPLYFIADPKYFRGILVASDLWKSIGWSSIIYLAAITGIDPQLYEAAEIDGATRLKQIWHITVPSILSTIIIMLIFATGRLINDDFDQIYNLLNIKVMSVGDVISTYTYREGIARMNYSYSTAVGLFKNAIAFMLVFLSNFIAKKTGETSIW